MHRFLSPALLITLLAVPAAFAADAPPVLNFSVPVEFSVARPFIHVTASCTDDDPNIPCSLRILAAGAEHTEFLVNGPSSFDQEVALDAIDGEKVLLIASARDSAGQFTTIFRTIYADGSTRLEPVTDLPGRIIDVDEERILFVLNYRAYIHDREGGTNTMIPLSSGYQPMSGYLTPRGAILLAKNISTGDSDIVEWQDSTALNLGDAAAVLSVDGPWAIWTRGAGASSQMFRRDLVLGITTEVIVGEPPVNGDVAPNGDVAVETTGRNIYLYEGNSATPLTTATNTVGYARPVTDGTTTVYTKYTCCGEPQTFTIMRHDGTSETALGTVPAVLERGEQQYQVDGGWIAFIKETAGQLDVWTIAPAGSPQQVSTNGGRELQLLAPNGEVAYLTWTERYIGSAGSPPESINSEVGMAFRIADDWQVAIGRSLFGIRAPLAATTTTLISTPNPSSFGDSVTFTATVADSGATGLVVFRDSDHGVLGSATLAGGMASISTSALPGGTHEVVAVYGGDGTHAWSASAPLTQTVNDPPFGTPANLSATTTQSGSVLVQWSSVSGVSGYEIARSVNNGPFVIIFTHTGPPFLDTTVSPNLTYLYKVRAVAPGDVRSDYSNVDAATTVVFSDNPLVPGVSTVKVPHIVQLRTAVNAMRASAGLAPELFSSEPGPGSLVRAVQVQELRTPLNDARVAIGLPAISFVDPTLNAGMTIKAVHVQQLREAVR